MRALQRPPTVPAAPAEAAPVPHLTSRCSTRPSSRTTRSVRPTTARRRCRTSSPSSRRPTRIGTSSCSGARPLRERTSAIARNPRRLSSPLASRPVSLASRPVSPFRSEPPPYQFSHVLSHPSHAPELRPSELSAPPTLATPHLMRVPPATKAVGWCLSRRFLERLLRAQRAAPYFGPVDVWAWRVRRGLLVLQLLISRGDAGRRAGRSRRVD